IVAGNIIHDEIIARAVREIICDFWKIGMIETRENSGLAQGLLAGLFTNIVREVAVVFHFFQRAQTSLQPQIISQINGTCAALSDSFTDPVTAMQDLAVFQCEGQSSPSLRLRFLCVRFGVVSTQKPNLCYIINVFVKVASCCFIEGLNASHRRISHAGCTGGSAQRPALACESYHRAWTRINL